MEIGISKKGLKMNWSNQFLFHNKVDYDILFSDIKEYVFENNRNYDIFKLTLKDNSKIVIHRDIFYYKDDFQLFKNDFIEKIKEVNRDNEANENTIQEGQSFYETKAAIVVSYILIAVLIAIPIVIFIFQLDWRKPSLFASLGSLYLGVIYFLVLVEQHKKPKQVDR